jgi:hypothetical protein
MEEQAVIVHFQYSADSLDPLFVLEDQLDEAVRAAECGEFDGHEIAVDLSDGHLYLYGPSADELFAGIQPILAQTTGFGKLTVTLRYGPPEDGVSERVVVIEPSTGSPDGAGHES